MLGINLLESTERFGAFMGFYVKEEKEQKWRTRGRNSDTGRGRMSLAGRQ